MDNLSRFSKEEYFFDRELSWLLFNKRVLNESIDKDNKLFERLKFLSITASNLDEFYMIRVASLISEIKENKDALDIFGHSLLESYKKVTEKTKEFLKERDSVFLDEVYPSLKQKNITIVTDKTEIPSNLYSFAKKYFQDSVCQRLSYIKVDEENALPSLKNKSLYVVTKVYVYEDQSFSYILTEIPKNVKRVLTLRDKDETYSILLEALVEDFLRENITDGRVESSFAFRILRNADISIDTEKSEDYLSEMKLQVKKRELSDAIAIFFTDNTDEAFLKRIVKELELEKEGIFRVKTPLDLTFLSEIYGLEGFDDLKRPEYTPVMPWEFSKDESLFSQIKEHDLMLIHPFESFNPVIDFIKEASEDGNVTKIFQTLYRVSGNSPIVKALTEASKNGKEVTVLVELKARFDEENNIGYANLLEKAGCHVIYGFVELKTHCKITLIERKEENGIRRYVHLGTGNYNDNTAKQYTDISFFTANEDFGEDAVKVFNILTGKSSEEDYKKLSLAPKGLREKFIGLILREAENAREGKPAHIIAKLNSLCDKEIIKALYEASSAGVKIDLIVRGICSLKVGIEGVSENITVRSIVGNYLEHSRVFYFKNGGSPEYYCSSADWMPRNMDKRIEILFPVERKRLREKLNHVLKLMLKDNRKAWILQKDGTYRKLLETDMQYSFQEGFFEEEIQNMQE